MVTRIHYVFDPMCGWCYGAKALVQILQDIPDTVFVFHPGGMIPRRAIDTQFRSHILQADARIADITGVQFGDAYKARVASAEPLILDSFQTALAIVVAERLTQQGFAMLNAIQTAHYVDGLDVSSPATLQSLAEKLGITESLWQKTIEEYQPELTNIIDASHQFMQRFQVRGFPTLLIEQDQNWTKLDHSAFYGQPGAWKAYLDKVL